MPPDFPAARFLFLFYLFFILYIFFDCKLLYLLCTLRRCAVTTMSIVYLFVSVLLLYVENSSLELMVMFIQPTLSFLYAFLVSRVGKYV